MFFKEGNFTCTIINIIWLNKLHGRTLYAQEKLEKGIRPFWWIRCYRNFLLSIQCWWIHSPKNHLVILTTINLSIKPRPKRKALSEFSGHRITKKRQTRNHQSTQIHLHFLFIWNSVLDSEQFTILALPAVFMPSLLMNYLPSGQRENCWFTCFPLQNISVAVHF